MVYNAMYPIKQNPYYSKDNRNFVKKKEDEESSQSARPSTDNQDGQDMVSINQDRKNELQQELKESKQAQATAITSRDANMKNSSVNIAQIIKDFKNTAAAIGTPDELNEEVSSYLTLVETQVVKDEPNVKLIKSNLKNASSLLDGYITETLQRPSKVVENWLDALFLQQINYKYDQDEINAQFLVKFPEKTQAAINKSETAESASTENAEESSQTTKSNIIVPQDDQLKSLFIQAKKYAYAKDSKKAMETFQTALNRSVEVKDKETQSKILYEIGKIYDSNDYLEQALTSYDKSLTTTQDTNIKTKAHFSMAQIYDDVAQFEPAINHYMSSISYAGENENFVAQSTSLTKIGNICSDKYNRKAFDFYSEAKVIAQESKNTKTKGYVSSNTATAYSKFNEPQNALKYYSDAIKEYKEADSPAKIASNYKKAADVMVSYGNPQKAKSLLEKALTSAQQAGNTQLIKDINEQLNSM